MTKSLKRYDLTRLKIIRSEGKFKYGKARITDIRQYSAIGAPRSQSSQKEARNTT